MPHDVHTARSSRPGRSSGHPRTDAGKHGAAGRPTRSVRPPSSTRRVLLLEGVHADAGEILREAGFEVDSRPDAMTEEELRRAVRGVEVLGIRSGTRVPATVLEAGDRLRAVGAFCSGTDQVDLPAATRRGVAVFNAPFSNTRSVVELALAEIIALTRRMPVRNAAMHAGTWDKSAAGSHEVRGRCLGIVGYGNIGSQLSVLAEALGMTVVFHDTADRLALGNARRCDSLAELLALADVVTLHVDGSPANAGLFGEQEFAAMRTGGIFLNLSRGFVVDHAALRRHLLSGHLAGAGIDVFPDEPRRSGHAFVSALRDLPNVVLTPHIGGSTAEAQQDIARSVAVKLRDYLRAGATPSSVNLPHVALPPTPGTARIRLLHRNTPDGLERVDAVLAEHAVHVERQARATRGGVGYLLGDVSRSVSPLVAGALSDLPETIRVEVRS